MILSKMERGKVDSINKDLSHTRLGEYSNSVKLFGSIYSSFAHPCSVTCNAGPRALALEGDLSVLTNDMHKNSR